MNKDDPNAAAIVESRMTIIQRGYEAIHEQGEQIREKVGHTFAKSSFHFSFD